MNFIVNWNIIRFFIFLLFLTQIPFSNSFAQILNVDRITSGGDSTSNRNLHSVFTLGFDINQEESKVINLNTSVDISYKFQNNLLILLSEYDLTSSENVNLINAGFSHLRFRFNRQANIQPELFSQYQWNGVRGMKSRFLAGANLRFLLTKDSLEATYFAFGLFNEWERWDFRSVPQEKIPLNPKDKKSNYFKLNCYLNTAWKIQGNVDLSFIIYIQSRINEDIIYPRISPSMRLNFAISKKLSISIIFNGIYDRKPIVPIKNFFYDLSSAIAFLI